METKWRKLVNTHQMEFFWLISHFLCRHTSTHTFTPHSISVKLHASFVFRLTQRRWSGSRFLLRQSSVVEVLIAIIDIHFQIMYSWLKCIITTIILLGAKINVGNDQRNPREGCEESSRWKDHPAESLQPTLQLNAASNCSHYFWLQPICKATQVSDRTKPLTDS